MNSQVVHACCCRRRRPHVTDPTLASSASRWGFLLHYVDDNDVDTSQTPPSLQARVGGGFLLHYVDEDDVDTSLPVTPPSLQTRVGGAFFCIMSSSTHHWPHPRYKRESVGSLHEHEMMWHANQPKCMSFGPRYVICFFISWNLFLFKSLVCMFILV